MHNRIVTLFNTVKGWLFSPRGKNMLVFCLFLCLSAVLWVIMSLNMEVQRDIRATVRITNVPDSVKMVSYLPEAVNISVRGGAGDLIAYDLGRNAVIDVDYKYYCRNGRISLGPTEMRGLARHIFGQSTQILIINPDTLNVSFTSQRPVRLPVHIDLQVNTLPNCALTGPFTTPTDSVDVYYLSSMPSDMRSVPTQHITLSDIAQSQTVRMRLETPPGTRAYPDSIDVSIKVEPMVSRQMQVPVTVINVPDGMSMITVPAQVTVNYTQPMSQYDKSTPEFRVVADFGTLSRNFASNNVAVSIDRASGNYFDVYLSHDSVEYILERLQ